MAKHQPEDQQKPCRYCGEPIAWTRNLAAEWANVLYCDNACKRRYNREHPEEIDAKMSVKGPSQHKKRRRLSAS